MREIKFRAWDTVGKTMFVPDAPPSKMSCVSPDYIDLEGNVYRFEGARGYYNLEPQDKRFILMQFTGLLDKNGKEIYEGDIVRSRDNRIAQIKFGYYSGACQQHEEYGFYFQANTPSDVYGMNDCFGKTGLTEVVGNIYENPELVEAAT